MRKCTCKADYVVCRWSFFRGLELKLVSMLWKKWVKILLGREMPEGSFHFCRRFYLKHVRKPPDWTIYIVGGSDCMCGAGGEGKRGKWEGRRRGRALGGRPLCHQREREGRAKSGREIPSADSPSVTLLCFSESFCQTLWLGTFLFLISMICQKWLLSKKCFSHVHNLI